MALQSMKIAISNGVAVKRTRVVSPGLSFTRDVPKVISNIFLHANWEQQTKESAVVDGTNYCVVLECLVTSIACIT